MSKRIKDYLKKIDWLEEFVYNINYYIRELSSTRKRRVAKLVAVPILNLDDNAKKISEINKESIESLPMMKIYDILEKGECWFKIPSQALYLVDNAQVFYDSDIILTEYGAIWDKYYDRQRFDITIPLDKNVERIKNEKVYIKHKNRTHIVKSGYWIGGVHGGVWTHFVLQYLPKLYAIQDLNIEIWNELTIIMNYTDDEHINELVDNFVNRQKNIRVLKIKPEESVYCEKLYVLNDLNYIMEHSDIATILAGRFTKYPASLLKKNLKLEIERVGDCEKYPEKIFLERHTKWGTMLNQDEVISFFREKGFVTIEPHKLSLSEKIRYFQKAKIVVGPGGSAFTNGVFSRENTLLIGFVPYTSTVNNPYISSYFDRYWGTKSMIICGKGEDNDVHGNYIVPLERIKKAYIDLERTR